MRAASNSSEKVSAPHFLDIDFYRWNSTSVQSKAIKRLVELTVITCQKYVSSQKTVTKPWVNVSKKVSVRFASNFSSIRNPIDLTP